MKMRKSREINIFSVSFIDVMANGFGSLAFLLILVILMITKIVFSSPEILTEKLPDGYHGMPYEVWLSACEGLGKFRWTMGSGNIPDGLEIEENSGRLHGLLQLSNEQEDSRNYKFEVICETQAEESQGKVKGGMRSLELIVHRAAPIDTIPLKIITETTLPEVYRGQEYPVAFAAEGGQPPYSWQWIGDTPPGLNLGMDGIISGAANRLGTYGFQVAVATARGQSVAKDFSLTVSEKFPKPDPVQPPRIITDQIPDAVVNREYFLYLAVEYGKPPYTWSVMGSPNWMSVDRSRGVISGEPQLKDIGTVMLTLSVTDSKGESDSLLAPVSLEILPPAMQKPEPMVMKTKSLPDAMIGGDYELAFAVDGGFPPYEWVMESSAGIPGVKFMDSDGIISGNPDIRGNFDISVTATDTVGNQVARQFTLTINPEVMPVEILTREIPAARAGISYDFSLSCMGGYPPYSWEIVNGELPTGLSLIQESGTIKGTPESPGSWKVIFNVVDSMSNTPVTPLETELTVLTIEGYHDLSISTEMIPPLLTGLESGFTFASDGGYGPYYWDVQPGLPKGLKLLGSNLKGTPNSAGVHSITVSVRDTLGQTASAEFHLVIKRMIPFWLFIVLLLLILLIIAFLVYLLWSRGVRVTELRITTKSLPNARASFPYSVQLACEGGKPGYSWKVVGGELPPGMELHENGLLEGRPFREIKVDSTKSVPFTVEVRDKRGRISRREL